MTARLRRLLVFKGNRAFTWLWWSETVSLFGSQVTLVAIPLLAALSLHASAFEMGVIAAVETLPYLLFSLPAGVLADRVDRRRLLILGNLGRALLLLSIPASAAVGILSLPLLCVVSFWIGTFSVVFDVAYQSYVPDLLEPDELLGGNQRIELSESAARTVGPGLGGALVAVAGGATAVIVDALSYLLATVALLGARKRRPETGAPDGRTSAEHTRSEPPPLGSGVREGESAIGLIVDVWEHVAALEARVAALESDKAPKRRDRWGMRSAFTGLGIVFRDRILRDMAASTATFNLASSAIAAVFVLYAATDIGMDPAAIGILIAGGNVGFVLGALAVGAATARFGVGPVLVVSSILGAIATVILPFAVGAAAIGVLFAGRFLGAFTIPFYNVNALALRQSRAPREALGRVNAVFRMIDWGALPVGALLGGSIGSVYGLRAALVMAGVLGIASAAWLVWSPLRRVRHLRDSPSDAQPVVEDSSRPDSTRADRPSLAGAAGAVGWPLSLIGRLPRIEWAPLAIAGALMQAAVFLPPVNAHAAGAPPFLYVLSSAAVLACVVRNLRIPGLAIAAAGGLSNLVAVVANGGYMPVDPVAARAAGHPPPIGYTNTVELANAYLKPLTDIIVVPPPLPFANVYSIGDLLIVIGLAVAALWAFHRPSAAADPAAVARTPAHESTRLAGTGRP